MVVSLSESNGDVPGLLSGSSNSDIPVQSLSACSSRGGSGNGRDPGIQQEKSSIWLLEEISSSFSRIMVASLSESDCDVGLLLALS